MASTNDLIFEATVAHAWNVQGDPAYQHFPRAVRATLPMVPNTVERAGGTTVFWLGPRSWLVLDRVDAAAVHTAGGGAFDVSASRKAFSLAGAHAADVLAAHCPLDLDRFAPGTCAQSLFGQINALYYRHANAHAFTTFVARSFAHDVWHHLLHTARRYGYAAAAPRPFVAD